MFVNVFHENHTHDSGHQLPRLMRAHDFFLIFFAVAHLEPHELRGSLYYMGKLRKVFELSFVFERHVRTGERSEKPSGLEFVLGWQWKGSSAILGGRLLLQVSSPELSG